MNAQTHAPTGAPSPATRFQVGKTYWTRSICDHECIYRITVLSRTPKTVRVRERDEVKTLRVSEYRGIEQVKPHGSYSMAAIISADRSELAD